MSKQEELQIDTGDYVVYPTHGVGKVIGVETEEIAGHKLDLFVISFDKDRMTLRVPVSKAPTSGLRKLSTRKIMEEAMTTLKGRARVKRTMWSRRPRIRSEDQFGQSRFHRRGRARSASERGAARPVVL